MEDTYINLELNSFLILINGKVSPRNVDMIKQFALKIYYLPNFKNSGIIVFLVALCSYLNVRLITYTIFIDNVK